ncbi:MAG: hypothetical protein JRD68_15775, partial [Deltaproteobacteria bacterium]|nr:hypothetical protein [Deltaproteobacteria bacterium]
MKSDIPEIHLELSSGIFKIKTREADYLIEVNPNGSLSSLPAPQVQSIPGPDGPQAFSPSIVAADLAGDEGFYQEISEKMFSKIGLLARELSLSLKDIPDEEITPIDLTGSGVKLEDAKTQLEGIVQMTEKATMDIMDLTESILEDCQSTFSDLENIMDMDFMSKTAAPGTETDGSEDFAAEDHNPAMQF